MRREIGRAKSRPSTSPRSWTRHWRAKEQFFVPELGALFFVQKTIESTRLRERERDRVENSRPFVSEANSRHVLSLHSPRFLKPAERNWRDEKTESRDQRSEERKNPSFDQRPGSWTRPWRT